MSVSLRNPLTGQIRHREEGWSWGCFLGSGFLGIPLYRRGLQVWGSVMVALDIVAFVPEFMPTERELIFDFWLTVVGLGFSIFLGMRANHMAIERYRDLGWVFADPRRNLL